MSVPMASADPAAAAAPALPEETVDLLELQREKEQKGGK